MKYTINFNKDIVYSFQKKIELISLLALDIVSCLVCILFAFYTKKALEFFFMPPTWWTLEHYLTEWICLTYIFSIFSLGLYSKRLSFWEEFKEITRANLFVILAVFSIVALTKSSEQFSRFFLILMFTYALFIFPLFRFLGKKILWRCKIWNENLLILGAGNAGKDAAYGLIRERHMGYRVVGFLDDDVGKIGKIMNISNLDLPVLGPITEAKKFIQQEKVSAIVLAIPSLPTLNMTELINYLQQNVKHVLIVPELKGIGLMNTKLSYLFYEQLFLLKVQNNLKSFTNTLLKNSYELLFSILFLPLLFIVMIIFGILIKIESPGPILFKQERFGKDGKKFWCLKFRTMVLNQEEILQNYLNENKTRRQEWEKFRKLRGKDPRVTKIGSILRKTSLDELPQVINILRGEMSLIGPRPYMLNELKKLGSQSGIIFTAKPGITGLWQVSGRNDLDFNDRKNLDMWYVLNWSLWLDIMILVKTFVVVLGKKGAY